MVEIERRRLELGWPAWQLDDRSGVQDGYSQKMLWADAPSGRRASWDMVQLLVDALFPNGFDVEIRPRPGSFFDPLRQKAKIGHSAAFYKGGRTLREYMKSLRAKSSTTGLRSVSKRRRTAISRKGGKARAKYRGQIDTTVD